MEALMPDMNSVKTYDQKAERDFLYLGACRQRTLRGLEVPKGAKTLPMLPSGSVVASSAFRRRHTAKEPIPCSGRARHV